MRELILTAFQHEQKQSAFFEGSGRIRRGRIPRDESWRDEDQTFPESLERDSLQVVEELRSLYVRRRRLRLEPLPDVVRHVVVYLKDARSLPVFFDRGTVLLRQRTQDVRRHGNVRHLPHGTGVFKGTDESRSIVLRQFAFYVVSQLLVVETEAFHLNVNARFYVSHVVRTRKEQHLARTLPYGGQELYRAFVCLVQSVDHEHRRRVVEIVFHLSGEVFAIEVELASGEAYLRYRLLESCPFLSIVLGAVKNSHRHYVDGVEVFCHFPQCPFVCDGFGDARLSRTGVSVEEHPSNFAFRISGFERSRLEQVVQGNGFRDSCPLLVVLFRLVPPTVRGLSLLFCLSLGNFSYSFSRFEPSFFDDFFGDDDMVFHALDIFGRSLFEPRNHLQNAALSST